MSGRYVAFGRWFRGDTDDLVEARGWIELGVGADTLYVRADLLEEVFADVAQAQRAAVARGDAAFALGAAVGAARLLVLLGREEEPE